MPRRIHTPDLVSKDMVDRSEGNRQYTEDDIGMFVTLVREDGTYVEAEIVRVFCPLCGEEFIGTKRDAGGFIAGHKAYHEHENMSDLIAESMGGV